MNTYKQNSNLDFWREQKDCCNCGSFALNVDDWVDPSEGYNSDYLPRWEMIEDLYYNYKLPINLIKEILLHKDKEALLRLCPWIEEVGADDVDKSERLVAYRLMLKKDFFDEIDEDFHFRVRIKGFWFEKCGQEEIRLCEQQDVTLPWMTNEDLIYDSRIIYFRTKKDAEVVERHRQQT